MALVAGMHYPRSADEFQAWFRTDADCLDYLEWLRWADGFVCPGCGHAYGWRLGDGRLRCTGCGARTSVTAGTVFERTRTPLTVWFTACWLFARQKKRRLGAEPAAGDHRVVSLAERRLLGTHQGSVDEAHLPMYLDEFVFRFNRRRSRSRRRAPPRQPDDGSRLPVRPDGRRDHRRAVAGRATGRHSPVTQLGA